MVPTMEILPFFQNMTLPILVILFWVSILFSSLVWIGVTWLMKKHKDIPPSSSVSDVSLIICTFNDLSNLEKSFPHYSKLLKKGVELVIVNDGSTDGTREFLNKKRQEADNLTVLDLKENLGKKQALVLGMEKARNDHLLMTDVDCIPAGKDWAERMIAPLKKGFDISLGIGRYQPHPTLLNALVRFETFHTALLYTGAALQGIPYMGVGRNLAFNKQFRTKTHLHEGYHSIMSGEDDLFVNAAGTRDNTSVVLSPSAHTISIPPTSWQEWWHQKRRHLTAGNLYKGRDKFLLGSYYFSTIIFFICAFWLLIFQKELYVALSGMILRLSIQIITFRITMRMFRTGDLLIFAPFLELLWVILLPAFRISNLFSKPDRWR